MDADREDWKGRALRSRILHRLGAAASSAAAGVAAATAVVLWLVAGVATGFPQRWLDVLYATSAAVTLVMVFVIQHTQQREREAIQRKLDELVRALPQADDRLIAVEQAPDGELDELTERGREHRRQQASVSRSG